MTVVEIKFICGACRRTNIGDAPLDSGDTLSIHCACGIVHSFAYTNSASNLPVGRLAEYVLEYTFGQGAAVKDEVPVVDVKELMK